MNPESRIVAPFSDVDLGVADFDPTVWEKCRPVHIARLWSGAPAPATRHAEVRVIWAEKALTARFVCRQSEPLIVNSHPELAKKTIGLWHNDVCEMFLAPTAEIPQRYFEFEAAPTGEWLDLAIVVSGSEREKDWDFQSGMAAAARCGAEEFTITMQVPWSAPLPKPNSGDVWRVNLFRCVGLGNDRYLAWQPTGTPEPYFHVPEAFGRLEFA